MVHNHKINLLFCCLIGSSLAAMEPVDSAYPTRAHPDNSGTAIARTSGDVSTTESRLAFWGALGAGAVILSGGAAWLWNRHTATPSDQLNFEPMLRTELQDWVVRNNNLIASAFAPTCWLSHIGRLLSWPTIVAATLGKDPKQTLLVDLTREDIIRAILVLDSKRAALGKKPFDQEALFGQLSQEDSATCLEKLEEIGSKMLLLGHTFEELAPMSAEEKEAFSHAINTISEWRLNCFMGLSNFEIFNFQDAKHRWQRDRALLQSCFDYALKEENAALAGRLLAMIQSQIPLLLDRAKEGWEAGLPGDRDRWTPLDEIAAKSEELLKKLSEGAAQP